MNKTHVDPRIQLMVNKAILWFIIGELIYIGIMFCYLLGK